MLEIKSFTFGPFGTNTYVLHDEQGILLIDPACAYEWEQQELFKYIQRLTTNDQRPITIIATHGHLDHLWGAKWATKTWNTPVMMHEADIPMVEAMQQQYDLFGIRRAVDTFPVIPLSDSPLSILNSQFSILHTPGHTPGSMCLYFPNDKILFSGDTLFRMGYGRTDLPGGNMGQLISSLEQLFTLPPDIRVFPGHGEMTTIGEEKR